MRTAARIASLSIILVVLAAALVQLRQRLGAPPAPPASLSGPQDESWQTAAPKTRLTRQPTILQARPAPAENSPAEPSSPRYWGTTGADLPQPTEQPPEAFFPIGHALSGRALEYPDAELGRRELARVPDARRTLPAPAGSQAAEPQQPVSDNLRSPPPPGELASLPAPAAQPEIPPCIRTEPGDSLWKISERLYGAGIYYRALYVHNRDRIPRPDQIPAGIEILTPSPAELRSLYPDLCPREPNSLRATSSANANP